MFSVTKSKDKYDQDVFVVTCEENVKENIERLVKRFFFLAYNASGIMGMGMFQARDNQTEDQIWDSVHNDKWNTRKGEPYGDYIFGRMVKTGCKYDETSMTVVDRQPTADYQSWVRQYPSYEALLSAAISSVEKDESPATSPVSLEELVQAAEYLSTVEPPRIVPLDNFDGELNRD